MNKRFKPWFAVMLTGCLAVGQATAAATPEPQQNKVAAQQGSQLTGVVTDETGEPLPGATVKVVGSTAATMTDVNGRFQLPKVKKGLKIIVSYVGCNPFEFVNEGGDVKVVLQSSNTTLNDVVVVGYGTQKKVNVTGAVSMVDEKIFDSRPVANVQQALQGAVPGLNLSTTNAGGELNASMSMNIRGMGTIGSGSVAAPLVLVDGIEGNMNALNPNDIESVSVLKDAAASSIYGARAAFGVILVTTKNGKKGTVKVNYSGDVRFTTATQIPKMVNSLEWATYFNAAQYNENGGYVFNPETMENIKKYMNGEFTDPTKPEYYGTTAGSNGKWNNYGGGFANTNWFKEHYKENVPSTQHNLSISGGNEAVTYLVSGSYFKNNGIVRHGHDENDRYTTNFKLGAKLNEYIRLDANTKWTRTDYQRPYYLQGLFYHNIARRWPTCPVIDPNGHYMNEMEILELEDMGIYRDKTDEFTQQGRFTITPLKGWNIVADGAVRIRNYRNTQNMTPVSYFDVNNNPMLRDSGMGTTSWAYESRSTTNYYATNLFTDYTFALGANNFKALVGMNYEKYSIEGMSGGGDKFVDPSRPYISGTQTNFSAGDNYKHRATAGYFGRLNYDYDGKYLAEINLRYDGSSRFTEDRRWAWFPSFSAGWNMAKENFFQKLNADISTLKLRGSWGSLGNTSSNYSSFWDWYPFFQQQSIGVNNSSWLINNAKQNTASLPGIINSTMTWETVQTLDLGFDVSAFNSRLNASFDWFIRKTKDMIGPAPILGSALGTNAPATNNCDMESRGWEFEISWVDRIGEVNYNARFNISDSQAKVTRYPFTGAFENISINSWYNGRVEGLIWGYETEGIAQTQEQMDKWLENNKPNWGGNWGPGDIMYRDLNGDGKVNSGKSTIGDHGDLKVIGNSTPRYRVGLNLGAEWKGIDFSVFFQGVMKRDYDFGSEVYFWGAGGGMWQSCVFKEHLDYWTPENPNAYYPRPYFGTGKNRQTQSRYLQNAAYLRCKNMQLGYTFPSKWMNPVGISNCRLYVSADNLFTITKISSVFDPEALGGGWGAGKLYPLTRSWSIGLNLSF